MFVRITVTTIRYLVRVILIFTAGIVESVIKWLDLGKHLINKLLILIRVVCEYNVRLLPTVSSQVFLNLML